MAHSYTPGLRVTPRATLRRERRLPLRGHVLVQAGDRVEADTVVARILQNLGVEQEFVKEWMA